jgi:uncharacterized protein YjbI with pentapeptide repeats
MTSAPQPPRILPVHLHELEDSGVRALTERESWQRLRFAGIDLSRRSLGWTGFTECQFHEVRADDVDLKESAFVQCAFSRLTASTFSVPVGRMRSVRFSDSRIGALVSYEAGWQSVHFVGVKIGFLSLRRAKVQDLLFTNCEIEEIDFSNARVSRVGFADTQVNGLTLTGSKLQHVDLRSLELKQITGLESIRGATLTPEQVLELAPVFARMYGILIVDK